MTKRDIRAALTAERDKRFQDSLDYERAWGWTVASACVYGLTTLPDWTPRTEANAGEGYSGPVRWSTAAGGGQGFSQPPAIGTRVLVNFNGFGLGTVVAYFVEHGYLGVEVKCDQRPEWHVKQNPGPRNPLVFGAEIIAAPSVVLSRAAGGHKRHVRIEGSQTALCGFKPSAPTATQQKSRAGWYALPDGTPPDLNGHGCKTCLAHPSSSYLAYFTDQLAKVRQ